MKTEDKVRVLSNGMPDYDNLPATNFMFMAFYPPYIKSDKPALKDFDLQSYQEMRNCGFEYVYLLGEGIGSLTGETHLEKALSYCDEVGLKAYIDVTEPGCDIMKIAKDMSKHPSFVGVNFDEPPMETFDNHLGLNDLKGVVEKFVAEYPQLEFFPNLNPSWWADFQNHTYGAYVNKTMDSFNQPYQDAKSPVKKWISADDYPYLIDEGEEVVKMFRPCWLTGLAYLAQTKKNTTLDNVHINFFIQSMAFGVEQLSRNRVMQYPELSMQIYALMAFGYDSASFFCYATPPVGKEFKEGQFALLTREGEKTVTWYDSQKLIREINAFQHTYMQFNRNWKGVYPVLGDIEKPREDFTLLKKLNDDGITSPVLDIKEVKGVESITATEDSLVGVMEDDYGNPGYIVVNFNDPSQEKTSAVEMQFVSNYASVWIWQKGEKKTVALNNGKLTLDLAIGEGVFVIPIKK